MDQHRSIFRDIHTTDPVIIKDSHKTNNEAPTYSLVWAGIQYNPDSRTWHLFHAKKALPNGKNKKLEPSSLVADEIFYMQSEDNPMQLSVWELLDLLSTIDFAQRESQRFLGRILDFPEVEILNFYKALLEEEADQSDNNTDLISFFKTGSHSQTGEPEDEEDPFSLYPVIENYLDLEKINWPYASINNVFFPELITSQIYTIGFLKNKNQQTAECLYTYQFIATLDSFLTDSYSCFIRRTSIKNSKAEDLPIKLGGPICFTEALDILFYFEYNLADRGVTEVDQTQYVEAKRFRPDSVDHSLIAIFSHSVLDRFDQSQMENFIPRCVIESPKSRIMKFSDIENMLLTRDKSGAYGYIFPSDFPYVKISIDKGVNDLFSHPHYGVTMDHSLSAQGSRALISFSALSDFVMTLFEDTMLNSTEPSDQIAILSPQQMLAQSDSSIDDDDDDEVCLSSHYHFYFSKPYEVLADTATEIKNLVRIGMAFDINRESWVLVELREEVKKSARDDLWYVTDRSRTFSTVPLNWACAKLLINRVKDHAQTEGVYLGSELVAMDVYTGDLPVSQTIEDNKKKVRPFGNIDKLIGPSSPLDTDFDPEELLSSPVYQFSLLDRDRMVMPGYIQLNWVEFHPMTQGDFNPSGTFCYQVLKSDPASNLVEIFESGVGLSFDEAVTAVIYFREKIKAQMKRANWQESFLDEDFYSWAVFSGLNQLQEISGMDIRALGRWENIQPSVASHKQTELPPSIKPEHGHYPILQKAIQQALSGDARGNNNKQTLKLK